MAIKGQRVANADKASMTALMSEIKGLLPDTLTPHSEAIVTFPQQFDPDYELDVRIKAICDGYRTAIAESQEAIEASDPDSPECKDATRKLLQAEQNQSEAIADHFGVIGYNQFAPDSFCDRIAKAVNALSEAYPKWLSTDRLFVRTRKLHDPVKNTDTNVCYVVRSNKPVVKRERRARLSFAQKVTAREQATARDEKGNLLNA